MSSTSPLLLRTGIDIQREIDKLVKEKGWAAEERRKYLDELHEGPELPLFAETGEDMDPRLAEALAALKYDGETPEELADKCKDMGNKNFKTAISRKRQMYYREAVKHYSEGCLHALKAAEAPDRPAEAVKALDELFSTLLSNRSACNLALKNYGSVKRDCTDAVRLNPANTKAFFRKAKACLALRQYEDGLEASQDALFLEPENAEVAALRVKLEAGLAERQKREAAVAAQEAAETEAMCELFRTCQARGAALGPGIAADGYTQQASDKLPALDTDDNGEVSLVWPCYLLYPQYLQSDFIESWDERSMVAETLAMVFPEEWSAESPPAVWDEKREYRCSEMEAYLQLNAPPPHASAEDWAGWVRLSRAARGEVASLPAEAAAKRLRASEAASRVHPDDAEWLRVPGGLTLGDALRYPGVVAPGGQPAFCLYPRSSDAHALFVKKHGKRIVDFDPKLLPPPPPPR